MKLCIVGGFPESLINFRGPLIRTLKKDGREILACAGGKDNEVERELRDLGISYLPFPLERSGTNPFRDCRTAHSLYRIFRSNRPGIVLLYTIKPVIYGSLAAKASGVRRIYSIITGLGYTLQRKRSWGIARAIRLLYKQALRHNHLVFFQNPDNMAHFIEERIVERSRTVLINGSGVDLEYYSPSPVPEGPPVFLFVGRILWEKGIREFIEASRQLKRKYPTVRFCILGPLGDHPDAVPRRQIERWVEEGPVEYFGETRDVRPYIRDCSVLVLPSYHEGLPRSVLEAMSMGRAVITTDASGCKETVVNGENGLLVPVGNVPALVQAMDLLASDPQLTHQMGLRGRHICEQKFDVRKVNNVILSSIGFTPQGEEK